MTSMVTLVWTVLFPIFCIVVAGRTESLSTLPDLSPAFDNTTEQNVTVQTGQGANLRCKVTNLGNKKVTWIRRQGAHILTVGRYTFTSDQRIQPVHVEGTDEWILRIKYTKRSDTGTYECQINSEPPMSMFFNLQVDGASATLLGPPDQTVSPGSTIILTCVSRKQEAPDFVNWYHNNTFIITTTDALKFTFTAVNAGKKRGSLLETNLASQATLIINKAKTSDSGEYTCSPSNGEPASTMVYVFAVTCRYDDLKIPNIAYDNKLKEVKNNEEVIVTCIEGFGMKSKSLETVRCIQGMWTISESAECLPHCLHPVLPPGAKMISPIYNTYLQEERIFINCSGGYFISDDAVYPVLAMTCLGNNTWEPRILPCIPKEHVFNIYKPQREQIRNVGVGERLVLSCDHQQDPTQNGTRSISWKWLKDSTDIMSSVIDFSIAENGSLIIAEMSINSVGSYTCLMKSQAQYISTDVVYRVKIGTPCINSAPNATMVAQQGTYTILICPMGSSDSSFLPIWYSQDGRRIFDNERFSLIFNSDLLIKSVRSSDEGIYICDRGPYTPFCERRFTYFLQVNDM